MTMNLEKREQLFRLGFYNLDRNENLDITYLKQVDGLLKNGSGLASFYPDYPQFTNRLSSFLGISPSNFLVTCGCTEAIKMVMDASADNFRKSMAFTPTYKGAIDYFQQQSGGFYSVPVTDDIDKVCRTIEKSGMEFVYLCNPNNPTGTLLKNLEKLADLNAVIFIDEAYFEFGGVSAIKLAIQSPNIIVGRSFSKAWGLAGLRIGLLIANEDMIQELSRYKLKANVNTVGVRVLTELLNNYQWVSDSVKRIKEGGEYMRFEITKKGWKVFNEPNVNFIWSDIPSAYLDELKVIYKVIEGKTCITTMPKDQAEAIFKFHE